MKKIIKTVIISVVIILLKCYAFADDFSSPIGDHNTIYIEGERHDNKECIKRKDQLKQEARDKRIILAMEDRSFGKNLDNIFGSKIFGIEELDLYYLSFVCDFYIEFALYKILKGVIALNENDPIIQTTEIINSIKVDLEIPRIVFSAPSRIKRALHAMMGALLYLDIDNLKILYPNSEEVLDGFAKAGLVPRKRTNSFYQLVKDHSSETPFFLNICKDISQWVNLFKDLTDLYLKRVVQNKLISANTAKQLMIYVTQIEEYLKMDVDLQRSLLIAILEEYKTSTYFVTDEITQASRDHAFLKNIINIFEDNKLQEKPFFAIVGAAHVPYLYEELRSRNYDVKLNEWAQAAYDIWYMEALVQGKKLIDEISVNEIMTLLTRKSYEKLLYHDPLIVQGYVLHIIKQLISFQSNSLLLLNKKIENLENLENQLLNQIKRLSEK